MEDVIDQVMRTYGMMVNLTAIEKQSARERLAQFLKDKNDNTRKLTVEGVKYLRGDKVRGQGVPDPACQIFLGI